MRRERGVGIGGAALIGDDDAVFDLDDAIRPFLEAGIVGHADDRGTVFGGGGITPDVITGDTTTPLQVQSLARAMGNPPSLYGFR